MRVQATVSMAEERVTATKMSQSTAALSSPNEHASEPAAIPGKIKLVILLGALNGLGPLSIDMYLPAFPELRADFGTGASQAQLTLSACLLGLALGQLLAGPISDAFGRRRPLLIGLVGYVLVSLLCAVAPSIYALAAVRLVQGFAGAAGIVISRAVVRDLASGVAAAKLFSLLMLVNGLAPILAPIIGGQVLRFTSWRGVFVTLAVVGVALIVAVALGLRETHPVERRQSGGIGGTLRTFRYLLRDRTFVGYALSSGLAFGSLFAYISGSPFLLQEIYGVSPQTFGLLFGLNAVGYVIAGQINGRIVGRVDPRRLLTFGLLANTAGALALLVIIASGVFGLVPVLAALFVTIGSLGFILPNATALALSNHARSAGSASALIGLLQFGTGAIAAPLVGVAGEETAIPMAIVIAASAITALTTYVLMSFAVGDRR